MMNDKLNLKFQEALDKINARKASRNSIDVFLFHRMTAINLESKLDRYPEPVANRYVLET